MAHYEVLMAGSGGQGLVFCASFLAEAVIAHGMNVVQTQSYGISQRGGFISAEVLMDEEEILFQQVSKPDVIIALNEVVGARYDHMAVPVVYDTSLMKPRSMPNWLGVPMTEIARELGAPKSANLAGLAAAMTVSGAMPVEALLRIAEHKGKPDVARLNMEVIRRGAAAAESARGGN
ncbi:2-oxoacid:acceptor oxidoreductase family protein [Desulfovibrio sp.]|uniref:2-oxoacid:acceptor oxidoreductase family protein n=1 Tax=Desulfovibrio sp. TaxID=885 RepID=UPI003D0B02C3